MSDSNEQQPKNLGEMENADAVGTMGSADCGDMLRMWIKFREEGGKKVIDKATFQTFGCETAIAVASLATEMIKGKTADEALAMDGAALDAYTPAIAAYFTPDPENAARMKAARERQQDLYRQLYGGGEQF